MWFTLAIESYDVCMKTNSGEIAIIDRDGIEWNDTNNRGGFSSTLSSKNCVFEFILGVQLGECHTSNEFKTNIDCIFTHGIHSFL